MRAIFLLLILATLVLLLAASGYEYLLHPYYWWLAFRLHVIIPLKGLRNLCARWREWPTLARAMWGVWFGPKPACCYDGCGRAPTKFEPRHGFFCSWHFEQFMRECAELAEKG